MSTTDTERRTGYIDGLRDLADLLEANESIPLPQAGSTASLAIYPQSLPSALATLSALGLPPVEITDLYGYRARTVGKLVGLRVEVAIPDAVALVAPPAASLVIHPSLAEVSA